MRQVESRLLLPAAVPDRRTYPVFWLAASREPVTLWLREDGAAGRFITRLPAGSLCLGLPTRPGACAEEPFPPGGGWGSYESGPLRYSHRMVPVLREEILHDRRGGLY